MAAIALAGGAAIVLTSSYRHHPLWIVWAALALSLSAAAGAVFAYGVERWRELDALRPTRRRHIIAPLAALFGVSVLMAATTVVLAPPSVASVALRGWVLPTIACIGAIPAVAAMFGIRRACSASEIDAPAERIALLMALRRLLQRLLVAVGSLVALSTLALSVAPAQQGAPPQIVLVFGAAGSLLVGLTYAPASTALQNAGRRLCEEVLPLEEATEIHAILSRLDERLKLEQFLGLALVDQEALTAELVSGRLFAVIDHTEPEVLPAGSPLYDLPQVLLTPHIAGSLGGELARMADLALDELTRYARGLPFAHGVASETLARIA
ncbi:NAD(P)-dependent oxidoreductase [Nonomuraea roseola]|uniref:NAD(P)-dependent oxidoreductase n=1 Tax=Nonomuraea roseola TaxID=46179 RepID=A0ABV5QFI7_9ACTN